MRRVVEKPTYPKSAPEGNYVELWHKAAPLAGPCWFLVRQSDGAILAFDREMTNREAMSFNQLLSDSDAGKEWLPRHGVVYLPGWVLKLLLEAEREKRRIVITNPEYRKVRDKSEDLQQQSKIYRQKADDLMASTAKTRSKALRERSAALMSRSESLIGMGSRP